MVAAHYKKDDLLHCWTSSSDISGYHADFQEGHGTVGAWEGRGMAWQGTAWARQAVCELALGLRPVSSVSFQKTLYFGRCICFRRQMNGWGLWLCTVLRAFLVYLIKKTAPLRVLL